MLLSQSSPLSCTWYGGVTQSAEVLCWWCEHLGKQQTRVPYTPHHDPLSLRPRHARPIFCPPWHTWRPHDPNGRPSSMLLVQLESHVNVALHRFRSEGSRISSWVAHTLVVSLTLPSSLPCLSPIALPARPVTQPHTHVINLTYHAQIRFLTARSLPPGQEPPPRGHAAGDALRRDRGQA